MRLSWVLFDLNGTLVDPAVMAEPLGGSRTDDELVHGALDDAVAQAMVATLTGVRVPFSRLVAAAIRRRLALQERAAELADAAVGRMAGMPAMDGAPAALSSLRAAGLRLGVLTQSSAADADAVLRGAGLRDAIDLVLSAEEAGAYKPDPRTYRMALDRLGASAGRVCLVAAHWWDVAGAKRAGLRTGWVAGRERVLLDTVPAPDYTGQDLGEVAAVIAARAAS